MESLKLPKSGSGANTPTGKSTSSATSSGNSNVSVTVRFNAGDECVESIYPSFQNSGTNSGSSSGGANRNSPGSIGSGDTTLVGAGGDSLASSPSQHQIADDQTNRNNFLQGNFFNRKSRSGSVEGISPTSSGTNLIGALSGDTASSVGTWKLFKGKVSQTIEDIKSSKSNIPSAPTITLSKGHIQIELDSDQESANLNPSISDENNADTESKQSLRKLSKSSQSTQHSGKELESDTDIENETLLEGDVERSRIRRGLANLKSKVKAKAASHHHHHHHHHQHPTVALATAISSTAIKTAMSKETIPQRGSFGPTTTTAALPTAGSTSLKTSFLRKRRKQAIDTAEVASPSKMPEEAIAVATTAKVDKKKKGVIAGKKEIEIESGVEMLEDMTPQQDTTKVANANAGSSFVIPLWGEMKSTASIESIEIPIKVLRYSDSSASIKIENELKPQSSPQPLKVSNIIPISAMACLSVALMMPIHDFIRGALATFLGILTLDTIYRFVNDYLIANANEKRPFKIPNYSKMPILEIPAVEEHTIVKAYSGWMNEVNSYDPQNFHISMSKTVFVKLEGTTMRISSTTARIPKKVIWNEPAIDLATLNFTDHRTYDLIGCRVELLPIGLARKRYFNRKYPIQLIIRNGQEKRFEDNGKSSVFLSKIPSTANLVDAGEQSAAEATNFPQSGTNLEPTNTETSTGDADMDFASTVLNADLQSLHDAVHADAESKDLTVPRGDEVRLLLFSRGDREKEDWYRRFLSASTGEVHEQNLRLPNIKLVHNADLQAMAIKSAYALTNLKLKDLQQQNSSPNINSTDEKSLASENTVNTTSSVPEFVRETELKFSASTKAVLSNDNMTKTASPSKIPPMSDMSATNDFEDDGETVEQMEDENFEGLIMSSCVSRNPLHYVRFMANYQKACRQSHIPVYKNTLSRTAKLNRKHRRARRQENELWKGIDQSLFLGPSGSVVWANVLLGRVIYSCLHDISLKVRLQDLLQRKLSTVKLPSFMENVIITQIHLGEVSPLIHRVSQPVLDERGTWLDADVTYEGFCYIIVTTKLNLLRLKRQARPAGQNTDTTAGNSANTGTNMTSPTPPPINIITSDLEVVSGVGCNAESQQLCPTLSGQNLVDVLTCSAIFDSEAESSGGSSSETESPVGPGPISEGNAPSEGNARRLFKLVDRFTASNLFQYATEISYVQRAMENMNANITLRVDLRGLVARGVINLPPPPSDRIWLAFRGPPRLWITAKPTLGDKSVDWSIVTNVIESKLCEQVNRYLVYPNMVDITIPFLGQPTYNKE